MPSVSMVHALVLGAVALGLATAGSGCGPVGYQERMMLYTEPALAHAEQMGAEHYDPYRFWGAIAYAEQARIMSSYSEYERALAYAQRSYELSLEAMARARMLSDPKCMSMADMGYSDRSAEEQRLDDAVKRAARDFQRLSDDADV